MPQFEINTTGTQTGRWTAAQAAVANRPHGLTDDDARALARDAWLAAPAQCKKLFDNDPTHDAKTVASLHLLGRIALDPREAADVLRDLGQGHVHMCFFGICNPVPSFSVAVGSSEHVALLSAAEANVASRSFHAAQRVRVWRDRVRQRGFQEDSVVASFSALLKWPDAEAFKKDREAARVDQEQCIRACHDKREQVRERRRVRLARLNQGTCPDVGSYMDLCLDVIACVLNSATPAKH